MAVPSSPAPCYPCSLGKARRAWSSLEHSQLSDRETGAQERRADRLRGGRSSGAERRPRDARQRARGSRRRRQRPLRRPSTLLCGGGQGAPCAAVRSRKMTGRRSEPMGESDFSRSRAPLSQPREWRLFIVHTLQRAQNGCTQTGLGNTASVRAPSNLLSVSERKAPSFRPVTTCAVVGGPYRNAEAPRLISTLLGGVAEGLFSPTTGCFQTMVRRYLARRPNPRGQHTGVLIGFTANKATLIRSRSKVARK